MEFKDIFPTYESFGSKIESDCNGKWLSGVGYNPNIGFLTLAYNTLRDYYDGIPLLFTTEDIAKNAITRIWANRMVYTEKAYAMINDTMTKAIEEFRAQNIIEGNVDTLVTNAENPTTLEPVTSFVNQYASGQVKSTATSGSTGKQRLLDFVKGLHAIIKNIIDDVITIYAQCFQNVIYVGEEFE